MDIKEFCKKHKLLTGVYNDIVAMEEALVAKQERNAALEGAIKDAGYTVSEKEDGGCELVKDEETAS